ncbi:MAG TPA: hypothetical protein VMZ03_10295 [Chitinophagaceae bacterium]|nr:hypothetical protein [Chitinophagaceae bacterium]
MSTNIAGEYMLQGMREMASGFLLNPDHTFQFFFIYGALDRFAKGEWKQEGDTIHFSTRSWPGTDFTLVRTEEGEKDLITVGFEKSNPMLSVYMYASLGNGAENTWERFDQHGYIKLPLRNFDSISLCFEFSPERFSVLQVKPNGHHKFIVRPEQTLFEVFLKDFSLRINDDGLKGKHPLMEGEEFVYKKQ